MRSKGLSRVVRVRLRKMFESDKFRGIGVDKHVDHMVDVLKKRQNVAAISDGLVALERGLWRVSQSEKAQIISCLSIGIMAVQMASCKPGLVKSVNELLWGDAG